MARGGARPGAGRPKGTNEVLLQEAKKQLIQAYLDNIQPINEALIKKCKDGDMSALKELHDRVYGKAPQAITGADGKDLKIVFDPIFNASA